MQPAITFPLILFAIVATIVVARRTRTPAGQYEQVSIWWMLPFAGVLTFLLGQEIPYYRFMNATAAPMALVGLGAFVAVRWLYRGQGIRRIAGAIGALLVVGALAWFFIDPVMNRWAQQDNQWAPQSVRTSLAAAREVVVSAGERPSVLIVNYGNTDDATGSNTTYGWAKTYTNVFRTGLPGTFAKHQRDVRRDGGGLQAGRPVRRAERELPGDVAEPLEGVGGASQDVPGAPDRVPDRRVLRGEVQRRPAG